MRCLFNPKIYKSLGLSNLSPNRSTGVGRLCEILMVVVRQSPIAALGARARRSGYPYGVLRCAGLTIIHLRFAVLHGVKGLLQHLIEGPAQHFGSLLDYLA